MEALKTLKMLQTFIKLKPISVVVFSTRTCVVCKPLKAKINQVIGTSLSEVDLNVGEVFLEDVEEAKGQYQVYTAPIVLVFVEGKEVKRYSAAIDLKAFEGVIDRYNQLMKD